ncbi:MAG: hypothetical protein LBD37_08705 [Treponema sp.]|jgi:hypothetical protein|nr:hypothetical protein [Treponema sp.]
MKKTTALSLTLRNLGLLLLLGGGALVVSCSQDPIFYTIENETQLKDPVISGGPTKIVALNNALYVASGGIYQYDQGGQWHKMGSQPPGDKVIDLAATAANGYLYALTIEGAKFTGGTLYRKKDGEDGWELIPNGSAYNRIAVIFGAHDTLFAGAYRDASIDSAVLLYAQGAAAELSAGRTSNGLLKTAAFFEGDYYVSIEKQGLFAAASPAELSGADSLCESPMGLLTIERDGKKYLAAAGSGGTVRLIKPGRTIVAEGDFGFYFTGAIAYWEEDATSLLLLGRGIIGGNSTTYYTYGYYELSLDMERGTLGAFMSPGDSRAEGMSTSVSSNAKYTASLGTHVVNSLYWTPAAIDPAMPLFAATQRDGLWSCRGKEWNVE